MKVCYLHKKKNYLKFVSVHFFLYFLLLVNMSIILALKDSKEKNVALFSSIISAAQRKVKRKPNKPSNSLSESKDEPSSPTNLKVFPTQSFSTSDIKEVSYFQ